jgi:hypothetical protein
MTQTPTSTIDGPTTQALQATLGAEHAALWCYSLAVAFLVEPQQSQARRDATCTASCAAGSSRRSPSSGSGRCRRSPPTPRRSRSPTRHRRPGWRSVAETDCPDVLAGAAGADVRPRPARGGPEGAHRRHRPRRAGGERSWAPRRWCRCSPAGPDQLSAAHRAGHVVVGVVQVEREPGRAPPARSPPRPPPQAGPTRPGAAPRRSPSPRHEPHAGAERVGQAHAVILDDTAVEPGQPRQRDGGARVAVPGGRRCRGPAGRRRGAAGARRRCPRRPPRVPAREVRHDRPAGAQREPRGAARAEQPLVAARHHGVGEGAGRRRASRGPAWRRAPRACRAPARRAWASRSTRRPSADCTTLTATTSWSAARSPARPARPAPSVTPRPDWRGERPRHARELTRRHEHPGAVGDARREQPHQRGHRSADRHPRGRHPDEIGEPATGERGGLVEIGRADVAGAPGLHRRRHRIGHRRGRNIRRSRC